MIRHPIYLLLCLLSVAYLALADTRGWSVLQSLSRSVTSGRGGGARAGSFHHK